MRYRPSQRVHRYLQMPPFEVPEGGHLQFNLDLPACIRKRLRYRLVERETSSSIFTSDIFLHRPRGEIFRFKGSGVSLHDYVAEGIFAERGSKGDLCIIN